MSAVSDTGPLIALAKVDQLGLLQALFHEVHIPSVVHHELLTKPGPESLRSKRALQGILRLTPSAALPPAVEIATVRLYPGERAAIALACERDALLLIDDYPGRTAACIGVV